MILFYNGAGNFVSKENENGWSFSQKKNIVGKGSIDGVPFYADARYAALYIGEDKIKDVVLSEAKGKGDYISYETKTLESILEQHKTPADWHGWDKKPLSFILSDCVYGFDYIRRSTIEAFTHYLEKENIALNKIKDGDIHLDTYNEGDSIQYYTEGHITFAFDLGDSGGERRVRWTERTGEKVYIAVQSVGSDEPITDSAQVDFSSAPVMMVPRGLKDASSGVGVPIVSNKRFVALRFILRYVNADYINDFASLDVYNENNVLVKRTVRGFTPVLSAFEIITRPKTPLNANINFDGLETLIDGLELSGVRVWEAINRIRKKYPFDSTAYLENGRPVIAFAKSLEKESSCILRADDMEARHLNNANVDNFKQDLKKVNVLHCYGEGEKLEALYVRIPETGTYDGLETVEDSFTDTKIKTAAELKAAGEKKLAELRKETEQSIEVETAEDIRLFDRVTFVYPQDTNKPLIHVQVAEEKISYKENVIKKQFGLDGWRFNPFQLLVKKEPLAEVRTFANKPFNVCAYGKSTSISLQWGGVEASYIVRWKKQTDAEYNFRQVDGNGADFNNLLNYEKYVFSVAGVFGTVVSEYTDEVECEPVDWATDPNNPNNAVTQLIAKKVTKYLGKFSAAPIGNTVLVAKEGGTVSVEANTGDWALCSKTVDGFLVGKCYKWDGAHWTPLVPEVNYPSEYQACLIDLLSIEELRQDTGYFGALFAKLLVTQKALIDDLTASQAFIKKLVVQKLHIDTDPNTHEDFEAWFDETNGLKINNGGEEIFKVDSKGDIYANNAIFENSKLHGFFYSDSLCIEPGRLIDDIYFKSTQTFDFRGINIEKFFSDFNRPDIFLNCYNWSESYTSRGYSIYMENIQGIGKGDDGQFNFDNIMIIRYKGIENPDRTKIKEGDIYSYLGVHISNNNKILIDRYSIVTWEKIENNGNPYYGKKEDSNYNQLEVSKTFGKMFKTIEIVGSSGRVFSSITKIKNAPRRKQKDTTIIWIDENGFVRCG